MAISKSYLVLVLAAVLFFAAGVFANQCITVNSGSTHSEHSPGTFTACTDKAIYAPGEAISISGSGYNGRCTNGVTTLTLSVLDINGVSVAKTQCYNRCYNGQCLSPVFGNANAGAASFNGLSGGSPYLTAFDGVLPNFISGADAKSGAHFTCCDIVCTSIPVVLFSYYGSAIYSASSQLVGSAVLSAPLTAGAYTIHFQGKSFDEDPTTGSGFKLTFIVNNPPIIDSLDINTSTGLLGKYIKNHFGPGAGDPFDTVRCSVSAHDPDSGDSIAGTSMQLWYRLPGQADAVLIASSSAQNATFTPGFLPVGTRLFCRAMIGDTHGALTTQDSFVGTAWTPIISDLYAR